MKNFVWVDSERGSNIEEFIILLCDALPDIAIDILKIGFGDLRRWYNTDELGAITGGNVWRVAQCGCLVGQFAVQAREKVSGCVELIDTHSSELIANYTYIEAPDVLYMAIAAVTKRQIHSHGSVRKDPLYTQIAQMGSDVGEEAGSSIYGMSIALERKRVQDVGEYLLDFIRVTLTGMGHSDLPKSPSPACQLPPLTK